jgi:urease accessory protein
MDTLALLRGIRFIDNFFPSGGYAFSSGLEAAVQGGAIRDADDLAKYVEDLLLNGIGQREAVTVAKAWQAASGKLQAVLEVDQELDSMKLDRETRMASSQMGRQVIRIAADQLGCSPILLDFRAAVEAEQTPGHLAVSLGLTLGATGWGKEQTVAAFLYQTAVGLVSAAMKLLPIGQQEGQRLLERWLPIIDQVSAEAIQTSCLTSWSPVQDIYSMRHSRLESRLFRS